MKGLPGRQMRGIPTGARLSCVDNTGAKIVEVVAVPKYHGTSRRYPSAGVGDILSSRSRRERLRRGSSSCGP